MKNLSEENINKDLVELIITNSYVIDGLYRKMGTLPNPDKIEPDINGYWIKKKLWKDRTNLLSWLKTNFQ